MFTDNAPTKSLRNCSNFPPKFLNKQTVDSLKPTIKPLRMSCERGSNVPSEDLRSWRQSLKNYAAIVLLVQFNPIFQCKFIKEDIKGSVAPIQSFGTFYKRHKPPSDKNHPRKLGPICKCQMCCDKLLRVQERVQERAKISGTDIPKIEFLHF